MNASPHAYARFHRSAEEHPEVHALEVGGECLTYARLRERSARIAARLRAAGGDRPPGRVGLLANRSVAAYAGYLGILRAGAAVVPLSPEHPAARIRGIVDAAGIDVVLTDAEHSGRDHGAIEVVADADDGADLEPPPDVEQDDGDLAYIIFTSGSTGAPKGVPITQGNLASYLDQMESRHGIGPHSRVSGAFDLTFDGSVHDLFVTWSAGGTLVVPTRGQLLSPVKAVNALRLSHWFSVPSLISFALRLGTLEPKSMPGLQWSIFGGEAVPLEAARQWAAAAADGRVDILYGPTEVTVSCTGHTLPSDLDDWPDTPNGMAPIGTCHPNLEYVLLDEEDNPSDNGELCVRGPQCFPGYLDPDNDAGRLLPADFDPNPNPTHTSGRWYRTGDRVALRDGILLHLGRIDHQVKINGHRIEPGEIEAVLRGLPGVRDATVLAVSAAGDQTELAAVVSGGDCDPEELYSTLTDRLPPYMLPRRISVMDQLPLNSNGKIDRHALLDELARTRLRAPAPVAPVLS
ncbi:MAG TPA: amino acid adenylation domain-containing protein [Stackebrandtia sp.]|uniref:amino acid adenylation domain-containing protein n=1 Tax=Stackebrandtia sp. TaxID=2023065 RepID=UPI002D68A9AD|nr:amino acid adenylation domain-containing protein [Stackebrandtia sp.]HZE38733.1 amino acid adenylation domain-containing protein [Stackebrandtia sp.]